MKSIISLMEQGLVPDSLIRMGIRRLSKLRLETHCNFKVEQQHEAIMKHISQLNSSAIAEATREANEQHYELPADFFNLALGKRRKYSACYWPSHVHTLNEAEVESLKQISSRAELKNGQSILELGCGWGSWTLWMAEHYPDSKITAVSNSSSQKKFIDGECQRLGFKNVQIITADINQFQATETFDRIVSVEMFEHVRNYKSLMNKISNWIKPGGALFVHIFVHKNVPYFFETDGDDNWMGKYFFTGGQMPSRDLLLYFQNNLNIEQHWTLNGTHYGKTSEGWLSNMDAHKEEIMKIFKTVYKDEATLWWNRWRIFFMAVAELFNYNNGEEWIVAHHLFRKTS